MPFLLRHSVILHFAFYHLTRAFFWTGAGAHGTSNRRGFVSLPKDVLCSQCSKGWLLLVLKETRTAEGRSGLKVCGVLQSLEDQPTWSLPTCVSS